VARIRKTRSAYTFSLVGIEFEYRLDWQIIHKCVVMGYVVRLRELAVVVFGDQGPEPRLRLHLQPLGLLYTLFSRSSHCRRQMSQRPTRRERSKQGEVEI
jgi:hypothetical protein